MLRELIIFIPMNVSAFWALVFFSSRYEKNRARYWLGIFMLIAAVLYACHAVFFHNYRNVYLKIDWLYLLAGLSVYPMYYFYIRLLTCDLTIKRFYFLHLIPAFGFAVLLFLSGQMLTPSEKQLYYDIVLIENRFPGSEASFLLKATAGIFFSSRMVFGFQTIIYLLMGYRLVQKYNERIANFYSNLEGRELIWVKMLTVSFLITAIASFLFNIAGRGYFLNSSLMLSVPSLLFSILLFLIGLQGNKQNFHIGIFDEDEKKEPDFGKPVMDVRNEKLKQNLLSLLENKKIYLNPELKITELCRELNTNRTYLSNLINNDFQLSFNDLINSYRVKHVISLIELNKNNFISFQELGEASGFGSLSSLHRVFKKFTGTTVGNYLNKNQ